MTQTEADAFLAAAGEERYFALWHVLLTGGLRPSEAFALLWDAVDFKEGAVHVRLALTRRGVDRKKHPLGWKLAPPKTKPGRRTVTLPKVAMAALKSWRAQQARERLLLGSEWTAHGVDFVFTNTRGGPLQLGNLFKWNFRPIMARAELGAWTVVKVGERVKAEERRFKPAYRIYDLRHTHATLLLMAGAHGRRGHQGHQRAAGPR